MKSYVELVVTTIVAGATALLAAPVPSLLCVNSAVPAGEMLKIADNPDLVHILLK